MAWYQSYGDWLRHSRDGGPSLAEALPGNLSILGPAYMRSIGQGPGQAGVNNAGAIPSGTEAAKAAARAARPPRNYDPNWFKPQGNAPATPSANAAVAAQSQVVRTPQEIQAQYEQQQASLKAEQKANADLQKLWDAYKAGPNNFVSAVEAELGGRMRALPGGAGLNEGYTTSPGSIGLYRPDVTNGSGQAYLPVPKDFEPWSPGAISGASSLNGASRTPLINRDYANSLMADIRSDMANGNPVSGGDIANPLWQRQGVQDALNSWVGAYQGLQNVQKDYLGRPMDLQTAGGSNAAESKALTGAWNQYQQDYNSTKITDNQAYLDMIGGGAFGGVVPWAQNPQWSDTTPTFQPQNRQPTNNQMMQQAQNSPWGQAGAPWQSQAWAAGTFNPQRGPQPAGPNGEIQEGQRWQGQSGMFAPQYGFNPNLVTNSPWQVPQQQNNAFGATNEGNKMTFGQSPWGSFW